MAICLYLCINGQSLSLADRDALGGVLWYEKQWMSKMYNLGLFDLNKHGNERFKEEMERALGRSFEIKKTGRKPKIKNKI